MGYHNRTRAERAGCVVVDGEPVEVDAGAPVTVPWTGTAAAGRPQRCRRGQVCGVVSRPGPEMSRGEDRPRRGTEAEDEVSTVQAASGHLPVILMHRGLRALT